MLTLTLWNSSETTQHIIELFDNIPINLTYQFMEVQNINTVKGSYSQTFRIPATKSNTDFFGAIQNPNIETSSSGLVKGNYSVKRKIKASLSNNSLTLMSGYVQIKAVYIQKKDFPEIELVFFADTNDFAKEVGDDLLSDLTSTTIDHTLNAANLSNSWLLNLVSGNVVYGMIDKGQNWTFSDLDNPPWSTTDGIYQSDLTPSVRIKWLVDRIFTEAGYTYSSTFFDSADFLKMYMPAFNGSLVPLSSNKEPEQQVCLATLDADLTSDLTTYTTLLLTETGGFDYGNNYNSLAHRYVCPYSAQYVVKITMTRTDDTASYPRPIDIAIFKNGTLFQYFSGQQGSSFSETVEVDCLATDYLEMKWKTRSSGVSADAQILGNGTASETSMEIVEVRGPVSGQAVDMSANFPKMKQIELIQSLQKMFNLVLIPDKNRPNHLIIEPYQDYISAGTQKDWTNKVDYNMDVVVKPTADLQAKTYDWTYEKGGGFISSMIFDATQRVYGRYRVTDPENDFAVSNKSIKVGFAPFLLSYIPSSLFPIHRAIDASGKSLGNPLPRICYYNGLQTNVPPWYIKNDSNVTSAVGFFPLLSNYGSMAVELTDNDLNYGYELPFIQTEVHPLNTLYYKYWMSYVNELYSAEARILTAYFKLSSSDLQQFEYSDKIYIQDTYYRILKISNYDATSEGSVQVQLLKILSDVADCADTPTSQNGDGSIRFNSTIGDYGSQACCERYGYRWLPRIGRCYPQVASLPPDTYL